MMPPRSTRKNQSPRSSSDIGEHFWNRRPVNCHPIENLTTESNYALMPPTSLTAKFTHSPKTNRRYLMSTLRITWRRATLWHHHPATVPPHLRSKRKMAPSASSMTTENSMSILFSMLHRCPKLAQSSKNSEESHYLANSISGQGITTYAYWQRTRIKLGSRRTKVYSNGLSCHLDYATPQPLLQGC